MESFAPCPDRPNCVSSRAAAGGSAIAPLRVRGDARAAWAAARRAVAALPRTRVVESDDRYLHAEVTSRLFRFVDDLELALAEDGTRIDVRSASRVGYSDLGVNRARVEALRATLRRAGVVE